MPIYTYRCRECDHEFEQRQRMAGAPLTDCPVCVGRIRRVVNSVGIVFKGSGFYITDNRNSSSSNGATKNGALSQNGEDKKDTPASEKTGEKTEKESDAA